MLNIRVWQFKKFLTAINLIFVIFCTALFTVLGVISSRTAVLDQFRINPNIYPLWSGPIISIRYILLGFHTAGTSYTTAHTYVQLLRTRHEF